jgi:hypothetical protein
VISFIVRLSLLDSRERCEREQLEYQRSGDRKFLESLLSAIDTPVAVFTEDWKILFWNEAIESVTGFERTTAVEHPELATDMLFSPIGGTIGARKLARAGAAEPLRLWELDQDDEPSAWRISRATTAGQGSFESAYIVTGVGAADRTGLIRATKAVRKSRILGTGITDLLSAVTWDQIAGITARVFLEVSGADSVDVRLTGRAAASAEAGGESFSGEDPVEWQLDITDGSGSVGESIFRGGRTEEILTSFSRGVCRAVLEMENRAIGASLMDLSAGSGGRFLFSASDGSVLFSTWPRSVMRKEPEMHVATMFRDDDLPLLESMMRRAVTTGRASSRLSGPEGEDWDVTVAALSGSGRNTLLLWWPVETGNEIDRLRDRTTELREDLLALLVSLSGSGAASLRGIRSGLARDNALSAQVQSSIYELSAAGDVLGYLEMLDSAERTATRTFEVEDLLRMLATGLVEEGHRPPDMEVADAIPPVTGNPLLVRRLLSRICLMSDPEGSARLAATFERTARMVPEAVPALHPWTPEAMVYITITGSVPLPAPPDTDDLAGMIRDSLMGPPVELGLTRYLIRLTGGELQPGIETGSLAFVLPAAGELTQDKS